MTKKRVQQFTGSLKAAQVAEGMGRAIQNAKSLVSDAKLLLENRRFARASSLAILAIEEIGKLTILRALLLESGEHLTKAWKNYRSHTKKNRHWLFEELQSKGAQTFTDFAILDDTESRHTTDLDIYKQVGFYTDIDPSGQWSSPNEVITEKAAKYLVEKADRGVNMHHSFTTEAELQLLVHYYKPVYAVGTSDEVCSAIVKCYEEGEKLGFIQPGYALKMKEFLEQTTED